MNTCQLISKDEKLILTLDNLRLENVLEYQLDQRANGKVELTIKMVVNLKMAGD